MLLDLLCGFLLVILTYSGLRSGMKAQLTRFAALALIFFGAPALARMLTQWLYGVDTLELAPLRLGMTALAACAIYVATMILSYIFIKKRDNPGRGDRIAGSILGFFKALIIIYLVVDAAVFIEPRLQMIDPEDKLQVQNSRLLNATRGAHQAVPWVKPPTLDKIPKAQRDLKRPPARRLIDTPPPRTKLPRITRPPVKRDMGADKAPGLRLKLPDAGHEADAINADDVEETKEE